MKLVTYKSAGRPAIGVLYENRVFDINKCIAYFSNQVSEQVLNLKLNNMIELLGSENWFPKISSVIDIITEEVFKSDFLLEVLSSDVESALMLPPILLPTKVIGVGMNFHSFVNALGESAPLNPILFNKTSSALTGHNSNVVVPYVTKEPVPEGELAIVIGKRAKFVPVAYASEYIAGYACANDISARNLEFRTSQWDSGKMLETFCPIGPAIVTPDEVGDTSSLSIKTELNGRIIQSGKLSDMIFDVMELVSAVSSVVTLEVGDIILTGTPSDLGEEKPPVFLKNGDFISVEIDRVGKLHNFVMQ